MNFMSNMKIRTLALVVIGFVVASGAVFVGTSLLTSRSVTDSRHAWSILKADTEPKAQALTAITQHIGYGGMIHQFKNYVLRKDAKRIGKVQSASGGVIAALDQYAATGVTPEEQKALDAIRSVVTAYTAMLIEVTTLARDGLASRDIDQSVKISDGAALEGLGVLAAHVTALNEGHGTATKMQLVGEIRASLGYGGMIHHFKNYVLRQDEPRVAKITSAMERARAALKTYGTLDITGDEKQALADILGVVAAYESGLETAQQMAAAGNTPEQVDKAVKVSDGPALKGLSTLVSGIGHEITMAGNTLTASLDTVGQVGQLVLVVAAATAVLLSLLVYLVLFRQIIAPVGRLTGSMSRLAEGDLEVALPPAGDNEIGAMIHSVQIFKDNAVRNKELEAAQEAQKQRTEEEKRVMMQKLADDFDASVGGIIETVSAASGELNSTAQSMASISEETSSQATTVASASEEASSNVQTVAAAAEEMAASVGEINQQMMQTSEATKSAVESVGATGAKIERLAEIADTIGEVVKMISEIAEQTNLLALNATIESARAGEAGKGFAVVAGEVKELAGQTAKATEGINQQIAEIQTATKDAVVSMSDIADVIGKLSENSTAIAAAMEEQGTTTREISRNVQEAATGTAQVTRNIGGVTQAAQEAGSASSQVTAAAAELSQQSEMLKSSVDAFIGKVRAA